MDVRRGPDSQLWAISCFFNPVGSQRRLQNYRRFRRHLNVPLLTVELSFQDRFELREGDAETLVRLQGQDVLWQKERLLNVALQHLPGACDKVAWLDCDVLFDREDWAVQADGLLVQFPLVQLFSQLVHLGPDGFLEEVPPTSARRISLAYRWATRTIPGDLFLRPEATSQQRCNCGMAWAGRRSVLEKHGLYDALVLGMGDKVIAAAAVGRFEDAVVAHRMNAPQAEHYLRWAVPFHEEIRGQVGYREGTVYHLWHGDLADRRYVERYDGFEVYDFDPGSDLVIDPAGCWRWNSAKPQMHRHVAQYFRGRYEDGRLAS
jgi:hypothetical protein